MIDRATTCSSCGPMFEIDLAIIVSDGLSAIAVHRQATAAAGVTPAKTTK